MVRRLFLRIAVVLCLILNFLLIVLPPSVQGTSAANTPEYAPDHILVKFKAGAMAANEASAHTRNQGTVIGTVGPGIKVVKIPPGRVPETVSAYRRESSVEIVEPDYIVKPTATVNDTYFNTQWGLNKINAPQAWDMTTSNASTVIAILDTGIDQNHPDLAAKIVSNYNATNATSYNDTYGHGTHVAGIAAAITNNGRGMAGAGYNAGLMNVKVLDDQGYGLYSWLIDGISWASNNGAKVINMSLGGGGHSTLLQDAINTAWAQGVVIVAAAGNDNTTVPSYPAYYSNCIAVAATDNADARASFSNYSNWVDVAAPGYNISSTYAGSAYAYRSGTSMATPFVSGLAALVWSTPYGTNASSVRARIENYADNISGTGTYWQYGRINAYKAVRSGQLLAWGKNPWGQLGDNTTTARLTPVLVKDIAGITSFDSRFEHSLAVKSDGTGWAWGGNGYGELGDGTTTSRLTPVQVSGLTGLVSVAVGGDHSLALKSNGTVWSWGYNGLCQLGDNTTIQRLTPVQVSGLAGVVAISAGFDHNLALKSDGTVWSWGYNNQGQLGDNTTDTRAIPTRVNGLTDIVSISASMRYSLALKSDGTIWAWGTNGAGELGDGTTTNRRTPVQVSSLTGMKYIAAGFGHSLALKSDGTVWAWGKNWYGQLGDNTTNSRYTPDQVLGLSGVTYVAAGYDHSLALKSDGTVWAWGWNVDGQLGDGTNNNQLLPEQVTRVTGISYIAAGAGTSMVGTIETGNLTIVNNSAYGDATFIFTYNGTRSGSTIVTTNSGTGNTTLNLPLGNYTVTENVPSGWVASGPTSFNISVSYNSVGTVTFNSTLSLIAPSVTTGNTSTINAHNATLTGNLTSLGTATSVNVSFEWGTNTSYGNSTTIQGKSSAGTFNANITGLSSNTTYHFRAKAAGDNISYGADRQFTTLPGATVTGINLVTGGTGYTSPAVSITGGGATTNALAAALGAIGTISFNGTGSTYTSIPSVRITGGGGSGAAATATYSNPTGIIGQWRFDEGTGNTAVDGSPFGHNGTLVNGPTWADGKSGNGLLFDGVNDYVEIAQPSDYAFGNSNFTISAWFKRASTNRTDEILSIWSPSLNRANIEVYFGDPASNNRLKVRTTTNNGSWRVWSSGTAITDTNWHQIAVVHNTTSSNMTFFVDGNLAANINHTGLTLDSAAQYVRIGGRGPQDTSAYFSGIIDEVTIWNRALSSTEINSYCLSTGLVGQYRFNEGAGNTIADGSPNGHTGTIFGIPNWTAGQLGNGLLFNGTNQYVEIAQPSDFALGNGNFTISSWFKRASTNRTDEILSIWSPSLNRANIEVYFGDPASNNRLKVRTTTNNGSWRVWSSGTAITDTNWYQVTVVNSDSTMQFYIDGNLTATINHTGFSLDAAAQYVRIGGRGPQDPSAYFSGTIDELAVWNRSLNANEVRANYQAAPAPSSPSLTVTGITVTNSGSGYTTAPTVNIIGSASVSGLLGIWRFDEGWGNTTGDGLLNGHTGTFVNSPTWTAGKYGRGLLLNGTNQYVEVAAPSSFALGNGNFTISSWFKRASTNRTDEILSIWSPSLNRANIEVYFGDPASNNRLKVRTTTNNGSWRVWSSGTAITDTNWHQVTVVNSDSTMQFYIDGNLTATINHTGFSLDAAAQYVRIGGRGPQDPSAYFCGTIDELAVWNRSLNADEVRANYQAVPAPAIATLTITSITLTNPGNDYISVPNVTITDTAGNGTGATATATISSSSYNLTALESVFAEAILKRRVFERFQDQIIIPQAAYNSPCNATFNSTAAGHMSRSTPARRRSILLPAMAPSC